MSRRQAISGEVKKMGFEHVTKFESIQEALVSLERAREMPHWILTTMQADQPANALSLLTLQLDHKELRPIRVSLALAAEEMHYVETAFSLGLYSWHPRDIDIKSHAQTLEELFKTAKFYEFNDCLTAAHYLREYLSSQGDKEAIIALENQLLMTFPEDPHLIIQMAKSLAERGNPEAALLALNRSTSGKGMVAVRRQELIDSLSEQAINSAGANEVIIDADLIGHCMVVEPDSVIAEQLRQMLLDMGAKDVSVYADGDAAWKQIANGQLPNFIVQEWRLPKLSGTAFLQRIRSKNLSHIPIVVYSSLVKSNQDKMLVKEMGVLDVVKKPKPPKTLMALFSALIKEERRPQNVDTLLRQIRERLIVKKFKEAQQIYREAVDKERFPKKLKLAIEAEFAYYMNHFDKAIAMALEALHLGGEDVQVLNVLGRSYMRQRKFHEAAIYFNKAREVSPDNIERICRLAESQVESGDIASAEQNLAFAQGLDAASEQVKMTDAKISFAKGDGNRTKEILADLMAHDEIIAFMNNRAIALSSLGKYQDAIKLYEKAIEVLPPFVKTRYEAVIIYNECLAMIRAKKTKQAIEKLSKVVNYEKTAVGQKIPALLRRGKLAVQAGKELIISDAPSFGPVVEEILDEDDFENEDVDFSKIEAEIMSLGHHDLPVAKNVKAGTLRCHLVFKPKGQTSDELKALLKSKAHFSKRN